MFQNNYDFLGENVVSKDSAVLSSIDTQCLDVDIKKCLVTKMCI